MGFFDGGFGSVVGGVGSIVGGIVGANNAANINAQNYAAQKEFAQNGIRWRVEDAKAAGLHPLAALGASPASYSPASVVGGDYGISDAAQSLGQGIDRARQAKMLKEERLQAQQEQQERDALDKELLRSQIRNIDAQTKATEAEAAYQLSRHVVATQQQVPSMPNSSSSPSPNVDPVFNAFGVVRDLEGRLKFIPTDDYNQRYEDKFLLEYLPNIQALMADLRAMFGQEVGGYVWDWDAGRGGSLVPSDSPRGRAIIRDRRDKASRLKNRADSLSFIYR